MLGNIVVVYFKVLCQVLDCAALADTMSDENDFVRRQEIFCYLFVEDLVFRYALALVVCFLLVNQVMMEAERVLGMYCVFGFRDFLAEVLVHMRNMMINHHNHPAGLRWFLRCECRTGLSQKLPQPGDFVDAEVVSVRMLEESSLRAHRKDKLITAMGLHIADLTDQLDSVSPTQTSRQLSGEEACME